MRYVYSAARAAFWLFVAAVMAQSGFAQQTITGYYIVASQRLSVTEWQYTYVAELQNKGPAITSATATLSTSVPNIVVVPGKNVLNFGPVVSGGLAECLNSFTIDVDRSVPFQLTDLQWTIVTNGGSTPPVANPGPNQAAAVGTTVHLNGSASTNPSGIGTLTYSWAFTTLPNGSTTTLVNPNTVTPTFFMDVAGTYKIQLTVSNGSASNSAIVTVSTDVPPVANAGTNQSIINANTLVALNGSASTDSNGATLTYSWLFTSIPAGSNAVLNGASTVNPTFTVDIPGMYVVQLIVNDGVVDSAPSSVTIDLNSPPVANAGPSQSNVGVGNQVQLDGSGSTDVDGDSLTYLWSLITVPTGSNATLSNTAIVNPTFVTDLSGTYVAQLIVNDGNFNSSPSTVSIYTGNAPLAPTAIAGPPQMLIVGTTVTLDGSGSSDPQGLSLTYSWSFLSKPAGSNAVLSTTNPVHPTFKADVFGTYVVQLVVSDGILSSVPSTVTISADTPPVASAGSNQSVAVGANVLLNGSGSFDADGATLSYSWNFSSKPAGSAATLSGANSPSPTFIADVAGNYVVQLIVSDSLTSSTPVTVTVTAVGQQAITLSPAPLTVGTTTGAGKLTVTLANAAPSPSGQVVTLASSNKSAATVPASVTIPANTTSATVSVTPVAVGSTTITASATGITSGTATVNVVAPSVTATVDFPTVGVGGTIDGHITLNVPAASATSVVLTQSPTGVVTIPSQVPIAAGASTATFTITGVTTNKSTVLHPSLTSYSSVNVSVQVVAQPLIQLPTSLTVQAGQSPVTLNVTLQNPAGSNGETVTLTSSDPTKATVTSSVFIAAGASTPTTQPTVTGLALGSITITASGTGYASASSNITVTAGPPAQISSSGTPQSTAISTAFATPLSVTIKDSLGNPVSGASVTFAGPAAAGAPGITQASTTATTNTSGTASVTLTANGVSGGPYTVTATAGSLTTNFSLTNLAGKPSSINLAASNSGSGQSAQILTAFANRLLAVVKDASGNVVPQAVVTFSAPTTGASGTFAGGATTATATTDSTGTATSPVFTANGTVSPLSGSSQTPYTVQATVSGVSTSAKFSLTNLAGPPAKIVATSGSGQSVGVTGKFGTALSATVTDAGGNPVSGAQVTFTAPTTGASGTFTSNANTYVATTNASGLAAVPNTVSFTANTIAGAFSVSATVTGVSTPATFSLTNTPAAAASIVATTGATQSAAINTAYGTMAATVSDQFGNLLTTGTVTFTLVPGSNGAGGKFATTTAVNIVNGIATASTLTANTTVGSFTVNATVSGVTKAATFTLTNTVGGPSSLTATAGTPQNVQGGTAPATALKAVLKDVGGNVLANQTVTFTVVPGTNGAGGSFSGASSTQITTDSTGTATMTGYTANFTLGAYTISAKVGSVTASFALTNITGPAAQITVSPSSASAAINAAFQTLSATVKDGGGNPVSGVQVNFAGPATAGAPGITVASTNATTNASGVATATLTANGTKGGPYTVTASAPGVTTPGQFSLTNNPGPATTLTANAGNNQFTPNSTAFPTQLQIKVTDAAGDLLSGVTVTFNIVAGTGGVSGTFPGGGTSATAQSDATGLATAPAITANGKIGSFTVNASAPGGSGTISLSPAFTLNNQSGPPAKAVSVTGSGQSIVVAATSGLTTALTATLQDAGSNVAAGFPVTFTAGTSANGATGTFANGGLATSGSNGVVTAPLFTPNTIAGSYTVTMTVNNVTPAITATYTVTNIPGTASKVSATGGTPQNVNVGGALSTPLQATVTDQYGNVVTVATTVTFTINGVSNAQGGAFGTGTLQTTTATTSAGIVNLATTGTSAFVANHVVGAYTITASVSGGTTTGIFNLTNLAGAPATVTPTAATATQSVPAGQPFTALAVVVKDSFGNVVTNQAVVFQAPTTAGAASGTFSNGTATITVNTDSTGTATAPFTANSVAGGPYNVTATVNAIVGKFNLTNTAGSATHIAAGSGTTPQNIGIGQPSAKALSVTLTDANNNPVNGQTVTFTITAANGAGATFAGTGNPTTVQATSVSGVATAPVLTANLVLGSYTATATAGGLSVTFNLTNVAGPPATIALTSGGAQTTQIGTAFANPLVVTVTDAAGNPVVGGNVTFTAPSSGSSLVFQGAANTVTVATVAGGVATSPAMTANNSIGTFTVTVTAGSVSNTFTGMTNTAGAPAKIVAVSGTTPQSVQTGNPFTKAPAVTVTDAGGNLVSGATVTFTAPSIPGKASGYFGAPQTVTVTSNQSGVATAPTLIANLITGGFTVTATVQTTVQGVASVSFSMTNTACSVVTLVAAQGNNPPQTGCQNITVTPVSVGQNLETLTQVTLNAANNGGAPTDKFPVTITSSDPTQLLLVPSVAGALPVSSLTLSFSQAQNNTLINVIGVGNGTGTTPYLLVSAAGFQFGVANITLTPSAFVMAINNNGTTQFGGNLVTNTGDQTTITLLAYQLDGNGNPTTSQSVAQGVTLNVNINDQNASANVGTLFPTPPISITGPSDPVNGTGLTFTADPSNLGSATLTVVEPTPSCTPPLTGPPPPCPFTGTFATPASGAVLNILVNSSQMSIVQSAPSIGQNLETSAFIQLSGTPESQVLVTVTSSDPTQLLLSNSATTAGSVSIIVPIGTAQQPTTRSATFYLQNISKNLGPTNTTTVNFTASASGFQNKTATATLMPSGVLVWGPGGQGFPFTTTTLSDPSALTVETDVLDQNFNPVQSEWVAGGLSITSNISSSNAGAGTISGSPIVFTGGVSDITTTAFVPNQNAASNSVSTISADVPPNFSTPASLNSVQVTVNQPGFSLTSATIGNNLQIQGHVIMGAPVPAGGLTITVTSNSSKLLLATSPTATGASQITISLNPGDPINPSIYLQAFGTSGTVTYTASAPGFVSRTANITLAPSGVILSGPLGYGLGATESVSAGPDPNWSVNTAYLNGSAQPISFQQLAGGLSLTANLNSGTPTVGTVPATVVIASGTNGTTFSFTPVATGATLVTATSSLGTVAAIDGKVSVNVNP